MATTRKTREEETGAEIKNNKRANPEVDRLSDLPEALQIRILASLHPKHAVQTSVLSKTWVSIWTRIPVLEFNSSPFTDIRTFDKFVDNFLDRRDHSIKLERLKFNRSKKCSDKILKTVFEYAFLFGVKKLEIHVRECRSHQWLDFLSPLGSFVSLTSLKLNSQGYMRCPFVGPTSRYFKNLTVLHLEGALLTDDDSFSKFPVLESLTLINCHLSTENGSHKTLSIHALRLLDLKISSLCSIDCCELTTPRLRFLDYEGPNFPLLRTTHEGLPVLETLVIDFNGVCCVKEKQKRLFDDMMSFFGMFGDVKSVTIFSSIVHLLSLFPDELVRRGCSPFRELKELKMDFRNFYCQNLFGSKPWWYVEPMAMGVYVKSYLLHNSPDAKFRFTSPNSLPR